jgi:hypothetical protein
MFTISYNSLRPGARVLKSQAMFLRVFIRSEMGGWVLKRPENQPTADFILPLKGLTI